MIKNIVVQNFLLKTIEDLRNQLFDADQKIHILETELDMKRINESNRKDLIHRLHENDLQFSSVRDSVNSLRSMGRESDFRHRPSSTQLPRKVRSVTSVNTCGDRESRHERKISTLPRGRLVTEVEETLTISRRTSITNGIPTGIGL